MGTKVTLFEIVFWLALGAVLGAELAIAIMLRTPPASYEYFPDFWNATCR